MRVHTPAEILVARYAVLIHADDSAHAPGATAADTESCDRHADELLGAGSMLVAYALTPRDAATSLRANSTTAGPFTGPRPVVAGPCRGCPGAGC